MGKTLGAILFGTTLVLTLAGSTMIGVNNYRLNNQYEQSEQQKTNMFNLLGTAAILAAGCTAYRAYSELRKREN